MAKNQKPQASARTAADDTTAVAEAPAAVETETLYGSDAQPAYVSMGNQSVQLGQAVQTAFEHTGLSVADWNALPTEEREAHIASVIDVAPSQGVEPVINPAIAIKAPEPEVVAEPTEEQRVAAILETQEAIRAASAAPAFPPDVYSLVVGMSTSGQMAVQRFLDYIEAMGPHRTISEEEGARWQVTLYRSLTTLINRLDEDFQSAFTVVLRLFDVHAQGAFAERYVFRYFDVMSLAEPDRAVFARLLNLMKLVADPKGRQLALRQVDLTRTLAQGVTEPGRQRVLAFLNVG